MRRSPKDVAVGADVGPWGVDMVSRDAMRVISEVFADPNPIHLHPEAAAAAGLGDRTVNQGPANFGYVVNMLLCEFEGATVRDLRVRLLANVFAGDRVVAGGRVEAVEVTGTERRATCAVWLDVAGGARVVDGTAVVVLPSRPGR